VFDVVIGVGIGISLPVRRRGRGRSKAGARRSGEATSRTGTIGARASGAADVDVLSR